MSHAIAAIQLANQRSPKLSVALLGPPAVTWDGEPLSPARRQTRALLYRLAAEVHALSRAQLCFLFWPDIADSTARRNLTRLLVLLRNALPEPTLLITQEESVALDAQRLWCDTTHFLQLTATTDSTARRQALAQAVEVVRGSFLDGFALPDCPEFEGWLESERRLWERRWFDALAALIEAHTTAHDYPAAIAAARRYLQRDDLAEEIHRRLMELYAATGERSAALSQFETCTVILERELGVSPLPETRLLYEEIRNGLASPFRHDSDLRPLTLAPPPPHQIPPPQPTSNLPIPTSPLIGRTDELAAVTALLQRSDLRLLTLSGPGGAGKTRLAIEAARQVAGHFVDGATFVPLAPLRDPAHVIPAIIQALGLREQDDRPPLARLQDAVRDRELLLVLDNCEHLAPAALEIATLLAVAPRLRVLATSRILLRIAGETVYSVPPLELAEPDHLPALDALAQVESIALYLARVRTRLPNFQLSAANGNDIAAICARLDGLPLAIELAAARAPLLSPRMLLARLNRRLAILTEGPLDLPERQRTLRATIEWSYRLLDLSEQLLFARLAVFAGSWSLEACERLCDEVGQLARTPLDLLQALLDKHLIQRVEGGGTSGEPRFTMLETIREFALEQLSERGESAAVEYVYANYFLVLAEAAAPALHGPDQIAWFDRLDEEHANFRVALAWLLDAGDSERALRLAVAIFWFWLVRGYFAEGRAWLERILAAASAKQALLPPILLAQAHFAIGQLAIYQGDPVAAQPHSERSLALWRQLEKDLGASREVQGPLILAIARVLQSHGMQGEHSVTTLLVPEINARVEALDDPWFSAWLTFESGAAELESFGDIAPAQTKLLPALQMFTALGDIWYQAQVYTFLGLLEMLLGNTEAAAHWYESALAESRKLKERALEAVALEKLGEVARLRAADEQAAAYYSASQQIFRQLDSRLDTARLAHHFGYLALHKSDPVLARQRFIESLRGFTTFGQPRGQAEALAGLAAVAALGGNPSSARQAARLWGAAAAIHTAEGTPVWPADQAEISRYQSFARDLLGSSLFEAAYAEGALLNLAQTIAEALRQ